MGFNKKDKIKSSSLYETVISLAVISTCIGITTIIFSNIFRASNHRLFEFRVESALSNISDEIREKNEGWDTNTILKYEDFEVEKKIEEKEKNLYEVNLFVTKKDKEFSNKKFLFLDEEDEN